MLKKIASFLFQLRVERYFFLLLFLLLVNNSSFAQDKVYIFLPTHVRSQILQDKLSKEIPGITITAFGRFRDFKAKIDLEPPGAIISIRPVVQLFEKYTISLAGTLRGVKQEKYILLSVGSPVDLASLPDKTIGIVDFMGRKQIKTFVSGLLPAMPKLKRVTKLEDLLPFTQF